MKINPEAIKIIPEAMQELETQIMLHIMQRLYEKELVTEEMYKKVKNMILTS